MEKTMLKIISAILIFVFYTIAFSSCSFIKDDIDNPLDDNDFPFKMFTDDTLSVYSHLYHNTYRKDFLK